jgi:hypothetical protein
MNQEDKPMKTSTILAYAIVCLQILPAEPTQAIVVVTTATVRAPSCCFVIPTVSGTTTVSVLSPEPAWHAQPIDWINSFNAFQCINWPVTDSSFCCIGTGNFASWTSSRNQAPCPVEAMSATHASVGGYGQLPYHSDFAQSFCHQPCSGPFCF